MKKIEVIELFLAQKGKCFYCKNPMSFMPGSILTSYTKDHFFPKSKGFKLNGNVVLCCKKCNEKKGNREPNEKEKKRFKNLYKKIRNRIAKLKAICKGE